MDSEEEEEEEEDGDGDEDTSTLGGSRHLPPPPQSQQLPPRELGPEDAAVDLFSQHQFIMPKPDETTPLIAADVENNLGPDPEAAIDSSLAAFPSHHRSRLLRRLVFVCLVGVVLVGIAMVVMMRPPPASGESEGE